MSSPQAVAISFERLHGDRTGINLSVTYRRAGTAVNTRGRGRGSTGCAIPRQGLKLGGKPSVSLRVFGQLRTSRCPDHGFPLRRITFRRATGLRLSWHSYNIEPSSATPQSRIAARNPDSHLDGDRTGCPIKPNCRGRIGRVLDMEGFERFC